MQAARTTRHPSARRRGFTLIELGAVLIIIGIIVAFILAASYASVEQARTRATQALISKLEVALNERIDALMALTLAPNGAHAWLAAVNPPLDPTVPADEPIRIWGLEANPRAEVIARMDLIKMELPDVFYIQVDRNITPPANSYPINFAGLPYPLPNNLGPAQPPAAYALPLGQLVAPGYRPNTYDTNGNPINPGPGGNWNNPANGYFPVNLPGSERGIYGASYNARAALHKLIGFAPTGTNGVDDDGDGLIDEFDEGMTTPEAQAAYTRFVQNHRHETARAALLYALLVEGVGPLGNAFSPEDFNGDEVKDTDGDGLLEFVDGWGKPLQFYRWPIYYASPGLQKGPAPFAGAVEPRPLFALDPTNQLVAPAWWGQLFPDPQPAPPVPISFKAALFNRYFLSTIDPNFGVAPTWERSGFYARRAFGCKFLLVSSGPDQQLGLFQVDDATLDANSSSGNPDLNAVLLLGNPTPTANNNYVPVQIGENWAAFDNGFPLSAAQALGNLAPPDAALDNIDNHNLMNAGGGIQ